MTLAEWAKAAEIRLPPPNSCGLICVSDFDCLDRELQEKIVSLEDYFVQSPPKVLLKAVSAVWMQSRGQVLDRALGIPQKPKETKRGQAKDRRR